MTPKKLKSGLKKHLKQLEKTRDSLRELYEEAESSLEYAECACSDLGRIIDELSEFI
jgi:hypothetical protein